MTEDMVEIEVELPRPLRRAVTLCAALAGVSVEDYIVAVALDEVRRRTFIMNLNMVGKALQTAANNAATTLAICKEAGVVPVARQKPGRKAAAVEAPKVRKARKTKPAVAQDDE